MSMKLKHSMLTSVIAALALGALAGCSSNDAGAGAPSGSGAFTGHGPITYVIAGQDTTGTTASVVATWNAAHPTEKVTVVVLPNSADAQRQQLIQNAQTKSDSYNVLGLDVTWTSEFAANRWIQALPADQFPLSSMLGPVVDTGRYRGVQYAVPFNTGAGILFYRTDLLTAAGITTPPATWSDMQSDCTKVHATKQGAGVSCYAGQFDKYEGLTINFGEAVRACGGVLTDSDGKPHLNTPQAKCGLDLLVNAFKTGFIPKDAITYQEETGRQAFQAGKVLFMRQWPYQYSLANMTDGSSQVAGKFGVTGLPGVGQNPGGSELGGTNLAISSFTKNKATALDFIKFLSSEANQKLFFQKTSNPPAYTDLYSDPALTRLFPFLPALKQSITTATPRPQVVDYGDVTAAIQENVYAALTGAKSSDQALADLQAKLVSLTK